MNDFRDKHQIILFVKFAELFNGFWVVLCIISQEILLHFDAIPFAKFPFCNLERFL
jgi:hypothetical protein